MRVIAGRFRGRTLRAPTGAATRPTSDRARGAIFNILEHAPWSSPLEGKRVLDLFAGSGALGIEALSRGAAFALFVETDPDARGAIRGNLEALGLFGASRLHRRDATDLGVKPAGLGAPFDLVFMDPPYRSGLIPPTIRALRSGDWLAPDCLIVVEIAADEALSIEGLGLLDERVYGAAKALFFKALAPEGE